MITLLYFAQLAEQAKTRQVQVPLSATPHLAAAGTGLEFLKDRSLRVAVNRRWAHWDTPLSEGDEVAFLPPPGVI